MLFLFDAQGTPGDVTRVAVEQQVALHVTCKLL